MLSRPCARVSLLPCPIQSRNVQGASRASSIDPVRESLSRTAATLEEKRETTRLSRGRVCQSAQPVVAEAVGGDAEAEHQSLASVLGISGTTLCDAVSLEEETIPPKPASRASVARRACSARSNR